MKPALWFQNRASVTLSIASRLRTVCITHDYNASVVHKYRQTHSPVHTKTLPRNLLFPQELPRLNAESLRNASNVVDRHIALRTLDSA